MIDPISDADSMTSQNDHTGAASPEAAAGGVLTNVNRPDAAQMRRRGRPSLAYTEDFQAWAALYHAGQLSARNRRRYWWAWTAHQLLTTEPESAEAFAWLIGGQPNIAALAELGRFASRHGTRVAVSIAGLVCRRRMTGPQAIQHLKKARALLNECTTEDDQPIGGDA